MNNIKNFPKSRVTVIDVYPYFKEGFKQAIDFCKRHNISLGSPDGSRVVFGYSLKHIKEGCQKTKNQYQTVTCVSKKGVTKKLEHFMETHFATLARFFPHPFCGTFDLSSPELEMAAESLVLKNTKKIDTKNLAKSLKLKV
jgi:hypothetical protein